MEVDYKNLYLKEKEETAYFMTRLYNQGLTTCSGGNISQLAGDNIVITPSQIDKGNLDRDLIGVVSLEEQNLTPELKSSMETGLHLAIYKARPDVKAIIHAHPPYSSAYTVTSKKLNTALTGEARAILGTPVKAPYKLMGSKELANVVSEASLKSDVILLENHGIVCLGKDLLEAFNRMEVLEAAAKISFASTLLGDVKELSTKECKEIDAFMGK